jgi:glucosamine--fructose-6-phosphate aminotransferase (isomerizing)
MFIGSDALAVGPFTNRITYLDEGDYVAIRRNEARIFDVDGHPVDRPAVVVSASAALVEKGNYRHFMEKEIHEQAESTQHTLTAYVDPVARTVSAPTEIDWTQVPRVQIVACGTAYYAGMIGKYLFEKVAGLPCDVEIGSEFRYRSPALTPGTLAVAVSQSGETADTLAALRHAKAQGQTVVAVVNVETSTMAREADLVLPTLAGPEIGVASTKAFTAQLMVLAATAVLAGRLRGTVDEAEEARLCALIAGVPGTLTAVLGREEALRTLAGDLAAARTILYLGRGAMFPLAMEGALKLKELTYIHAEGYAAGELKHGPIALIDETVPVVALAPRDGLFDKTVSNLQEVMARKGRVALIGDAAALAEAREGAWRTVAMPEVDPFTAPVAYAVAVQLLAYHAAVAKGTDVDQPRNLAKSVTVE